MDLNEGRAAPRALWLFGILSMATVAELLFGAGGIITALAVLFLSARLGARTIRAFVQGVNEGDDPRHAKLPPGPP